MKIYVINGAPCSGKTTFEKMVTQILGTSFCYTYSTIDFVKGLAKQCGWDGTKDLKNRKFLSDLKDLLTEWDDVPFKRVKDFVSMVEDDFDRYDVDSSRAAIFIDCREPAEIKKLCDRLGAQSLLIRRASVESNETSNHADAEVMNYDYDIVIPNQGSLQDLAAAAIEFVKNEKLRFISENYSIDAAGNISFS